MERSHNITIQATSFHSRLDLMQSSSQLFFRVSENEKNPAQQKIRVSGDGERVTYACAQGEHNGELGPVPQKPINANLRLKINQAVYFSTPKCC